MKKTDGFTLIELVVGILATTLVSGAIMTFLLMGLKANRATIDANTDQRNAKIMISMMEKLASEGAIKSVEYVGGDENENRDWLLYDHNNTVILSYSGARGALLGRDGSSMMENVLASSIELSQEDDTLTGRLLTFALKTAQSEYSSSVYCRLSGLDTSADENIKDEDAIESNYDSDLIDKDSSQQRVAFLTELLSQLGSTGSIMENGVETDETYSLWYCNGAYWPGWNKDTPWCACFVSWGLDQVSDYLDNTPREANVDNLCLIFLRSNGVINRDSASDLGGILPGDLIFFDWDDDSSSETDLEHVGVVLFIEGNFVYTIEGNSGGQVALRRYSLKDDSIFGYAQLAWS